MGADGIYKKIDTFNKGLQFPAIASNSITTIDQASTSSYKAKVEKKSLRSSTTKIAPASITTTGQAHATTARAS